MLYSGVGQQISRFPVKPHIRSCRIRRQGAVDGGATSQSLCGRSNVSNRCVDKMRRECSPGRAYDDYRQNATEYAGAQHVWTTTTVTVPHPAA